MKATEYLCPSCRQVLTEGHFYQGLGIQNGGRIPYCKDCSIMKYNKYSAIIGEDAAAWCLMAELGVPFIKGLWFDAKELSKRPSNDKDIVYLYLKKLRESTKIYQGFWDSDTSLAQLMKDYNIVETNSMNLDVMRKKWGTYEDYTEAYPFLEETFEEYTSNLLEMDANLERRYMDLVIAEYTKRKAQESGDPTKISKAQDIVTDLLKLLKLDKFQDNKQSDEEKRIERMAWIIENTRPAECEDLEKYKDFSGTGKMWDDLKRCLQNLIAGTKDYPDIPKNVM